MRDHCNNSPRVKEVRLDSTPEKRWIVCHNPAEATRDKALRDAAVARPEVELDTIAKAQARDRARATKTKREPSDDAPRKAECAVRDHKTLGRYLRQSPTGRLQIDRAAIRSEERLDAKDLLPTSAPDLSAEDVAFGYRDLFEAERGFRDLESTLELRPCAIASSPASAPTSCRAGSPCCSSASPNDAATPPHQATPP